MQKNQIERELSWSYWKLQLIQTAGLAVQTTVFVANWGSGIVFIPVMCFFAHLYFMVENYDWLQRMRKKFL